MSDCVFCQIAKGTLSTNKFFENDQIIAFESNQPVAEIHTLVIPKKHINSFSELDGETIAAMLQAAQKVINEKNISTGYKTIFNGGKYQAIPHVHWHIIGGKLEDESDILQNT